MLSTTDACYTLLFSLLLMSALKLHVTSSHGWCAEKSSHSSKARSPWHHLCHLHHVCRQQPFLRCCSLFPLALTFSEVSHDAFRSQLQVTFSKRQIWDRTESEAESESKRVAYYFDIFHLKHFPHSLRSIIFRLCFSPGFSAWVQELKIDFFSFFF